MFVLANFISAAAHILDIILNIVCWLVIIRALISWVNPDPGNAIVQFLYKTTEPILEPIRRHLPLNMRWGIDLSPVIVFLVIVFLKSFLIKSLFDLSLWLRFK
ncbi:MAG TPA: YggT family protein [Candidatus Omnitrophota bacterium]|nr:YggT family protein [Candidatus Omnitrophota bacterium]